MNTHNPPPSQKQLLLLAVSFLTRIPVTLNFEVSTTALNQASRYFALVGVLLAGILSLGYLVFSY
ncbi:adenosylcobinamide-GDP ribazoletransferase, partial [Pseudoalteromonas lipolytica]|uniref:adenosylcobinamide-GDP ribazoletransferase n=2 Tax=Pseudoalteromonas TaxID=53246 RepID=UPI00241DF89D